MLPCYSIFCGHSLTLLGSTWQNYGSNKMEPKPTRLIIPWQLLEKCFLTLDLLFWRCPLACTLAGSVICDFFLWGYLKSKVYCNKLCTLNDLKVAISEEIAAVSNDTLTKVMMNFEEKLLMCIGKGRFHLSDVVFKK